MYKCILYAASHSRARCNARRQSIINLYYFIVYGIFLLRGVALHYNILSIFIVFISYVRISMRFEIFLGKLERKQHWFLVRFAVYAIDFLITFIINNLPNCPNPFKSDNDYYYYTAV